MTTPFLKNSTIRTRLQKIARSRRDLRIVFDREMRRLNAEIADIQARCEHTCVTFYPDAAGGSGSSHDCDICGYSSRLYVVANPKRAKEVQAKQSCPRTQ